MKNANAIQRLTALWALSESGLGGMMHALKIPFTGFVLGGFAIIIITLIAQFSEKPFQSIIKATFWVIAVKAAASPHTPPMAYIAVSFQGLIGACIYSLIPYMRLASILFGALALLESAIQKFLVTTLLFGKSIWEALDTFGASVLKELSVVGAVSFSFWLIASYTFIYVCWGMVLGLWASGLMNRLMKKKEMILATYHTTVILQESNMNSASSNKNRKLVWFLCIILFIVTVFLLQGTSHKALYAIVRSLAAIILFFYLVTPFIQWCVKRWMAKYEQSTSFTQIMDALPKLSQDVKIAYAIAKNEHIGLSRSKSFVENLLILALFSNDS